MRVGVLRQAQIVYEQLTPREFPSNTIFPRAQCIPFPGIPGSISYRRAPHTTAKQRRGICLGTVGAGRIWPITI